MDGPIAVYRNRTDDEIRDIYVSRYEMGAWTVGKPVHNDGWHVEACPVNGPVVSAHGKDVTVLEQPALDTVIAAARNRLRAA